ncbi:hypothetical protein SAPIO_CDS4941 [Scedosporium apiospermum]|uniref:Cell wall protein n=1 Tax=Pseudallescheria apiosperma TaxID=563466 RepID=A0A084G7D5_PSEDA|nr:uncharacterized protein SAPIO_CDS4941 [Scedosporium apiospermum]KEZ43247.1 hypothetical protein SAPIO_CDS4941 [Scedosporium apiospermum]
MKFLSTLIPLGLFGSIMAMPSAPEALIVKRTTNFNDLFAQVDAHISAAVSTCVEAAVDNTAALEIRESIAAEIEADLAACADLLAEAAAQLKVSAEVDVVADNSGCDRSCVETLVVDKSRNFCEDARDVVDRLGEEAVKVYVKPALKAFGEFTVSLNSVFAGIGASINTVVKSALGAALSISLGLDLDVLLDIGLGLGGGIGIGGGKM